jgi:putative ABC transport system permease protein
VRPAALLRLASRGLLLHKLRSALSILGVVFGVAAVVAMSSVGEGARREALAQVGSLGIDTLTVRARPAAATPSRGLGLRLRDLESVRAVLPGLVAAAPVREATLLARHEGRDIQTNAVGTTAAYRLAARLELTKGRFIADIDVADHKRVAVVGAKVAARLFPLVEAVGGWIRLGQDWYEVVGVLEGRALPKAKGSPIRTRDVDGAVFVPWSALDAGGGGDAESLDEAVIRVSDPETITTTAEGVRGILARASGGAAFDVVVPREILRQRERTQRVFNVVTGAIAAISLVVGGIGIMNIMLATVAERRREVGVRRALGARRVDIAAQFLAEATLLTSSGGLLGLLLGVLGAILIQRYADWPTAVAPQMLPIALGVALAVGIGFGSYPAWHAAELQPMEALRAE